jgi:hypothetical protein
LRPLTRSSLLSDCMLWIVKEQGIRKRTVHAPPRRVLDTLRLVASSGGPGRCEFALNNACNALCRLGSACRSVPRCGRCQSPVPKSLVEFLFLVLTLCAITIIFVRLALRLDYHLDVRLAFAIVGAARHYEPAFFEVAGRSGNRKMFGTSMDAHLHYYTVVLVQERRIIGACQQRPEPRRRWPSGFLPLSNDRTLG